MRKFRRDLWRLILFGALRRSRIQAKTTRNNIEILPRETPYAQTTGKAAGCTVRAVHEARIYDDDDDDDDDDGDDDDVDDG